MGNKMDFAYVLSGLLVGTIVGMTGVGGGSLMTPLLIVLFGVQPPVAVGTDLLYAALTKTGGAWVRIRSGQVDWRISGLLASGSLPAALLTLALLNAADRHALSSIISTSLGVALILTAGALLYKERAFIRLSDKHITAATVATGAMLGILVTISSVGAGALGTVALYYLYPRLTADRVIGTDIAHAVPLTLIAGAGHFALGTVDFHLLLNLLLGSLPGIFIGSRLGSKIPEKMLRGALAGMLFLIGGILI